VRDLFGDVPVTWDEIYLWIEIVARIERDSWRAPYYIEYWNVAEKIKAAKLKGEFPPKPLGFVTATE
jgi:hypothetical protein